MIEQMNHGKPCKILRYKSFLRIIMLRQYLAPLIAAGLATVLAPAAHAAPAYTSRVLVNNLANPRGLLVRGDQLLVSEAGSGGPAGASNCITSGAFTTLCSGLSGALGSWNLTNQTYTRVLTGLPSLAQTNGTEGTGLADLANGGPTGLLGIFGFGANPNLLTPILPGNNLFARVVSIDLSTNNVQPRANLAAYEKDYNPDGRDLNSNPYAVQVFGGKLYATDAGGNTLLTLGLTPNPSDGLLPIESAFAFPTTPITPPPTPPGAPDPFPASAVPTGLTVNPATNTLLIGEFSGYPFVPGSASVYATTGLMAPLVSLTGFSTITDVTADNAGNSYVLEYNFLPAAGGIWRVTPGGGRERIIDGLTEPTSLALGPDGTIFVTNKADGLQGELLEYRPTPAPLPLFGAALAWRQARRLRQRVRQSRPGAASAS